MGCPIMMDPMLYDVIGRWQRLSAEEEQELCARVQADVDGYRARLERWQESGSPPDRKPELDVSNLNELVLRNLRLAMHYSGRCRSRGVEVEDLFQEAVLALLTAAKKFDVGRGVKFATYASWWLRQYLQRHVQGHKSTVQLPQNAIRLLMDYRRLKSECLSEKLRKPTRAEVMRRLGCDEDACDLVVRLDRRVTISLSGGYKEDPSWEGELTDPHGEDAAFRAACHGEDWDRLVELFRHLPERHRVVLEMRYGLNGRRPMALQEAGQALGVTRERVRQLEERAIEKLRKVVARRTRT